MKTKKIILGLIALVAITLLLNLAFKINYSEKEFYEFSDLKLSNSISVKSGKIFIGKNIQGEIEAVIFPEQYLDKGIKKDIEYIYLRFHPNWFKDNLTNVIIKPTVKPDKDLFKNAKKIHSENFKHFSHINSYPITQKGNLSMIIKMKDSTEKETLVYNVKKY